jgi:putative nucleotidyltransferase with HDIG domain
MIEGVLLNYHDITMRKELERLDRELESIIDVIGAVTEMRDPYTAGHQRRVAQLATAIARDLGMSAPDVADVRVAGLMHDVGKMSVPAELLSKPHGLTRIEFDLVRGHAAAGYEIISSANMPEPIPSLVHQHHERIDGSGYPLGLHGDQLLPGSTVLMVADVAEAMMSHRPYRAALGREVALAEIERGAGSVYDRGVAESCVRVFRDDGFEFTEE